MLSQYVYARAFNATGKVTGDAANLSGKIAKDGGTFSALTNGATEVEPGLYRFELTTAERTGSSFNFAFVSTTDDVEVLLDVGVRDECNIIAVDGVAVDDITDFHSPNTVHVHSASQPLTSLCAPQEDLPNIVTGTTWPGISVTALKDLDDNVIDLTGASIVMEVREDKTQAVADLQLTSGAGEITITNAAQGKFNVNNVLIELSEANYYYKIEVTTADSVVYLVKRGRWQVLNA